MKKDHLDGLSITLLILICACWGLQNVAIKLSAADISPMMQSGLRSIGASIMVGLWMILRKNRLFESDKTLWWGVWAGLLFAGEFLLVYWGLEFTNASRAVIFLYTSPFIVAVGSQMFLPNEKLNKLQYIGLSSAFFGIIIAFGESFTLPSETMLIGDAMLILAGSWLLGEPGIVRLSNVAIYSLVYQTFWIATVSYLVWFWLVRHYPAPKLTSFHFLTPLFGVVAGIVVLDEPLTPALSVAAIFVAIGIYLVNRPAR